MSEVRVRFAPSPTGALHIGGVRTALYNYLFAKKLGGKFILRIEDTDQGRFVEGAENYIKESLEWVGIQIDESPWNPGEYGPYRQSERKADYMAYAKQLVDQGNAYYAFDTAEELDAMRERLKAAKVPMPQYNGITRMSMKNSLTLSAKEVQGKLDAGEPYVIRLKVPIKEEVRLNDLIRGWVMVHSESIDDKVIMKSDGMPTYHLANIVDDHLMKITHVIRGEEWLPSAPLHVLLYKYLGWEKEMPQFAHLPLILKPDGNGKLSKRAADQLGFPVFPLNWTDPSNEELSVGFKETGYLPEAVVNFLSFLGWNPGTEQELFSMEALEKEFSIERINKAGTKFDIDKAKWYNQQYLKEKSNTELASYLIEQAESSGLSCDIEKAIVICGLLKERVTFPTEFLSQGKYFFEAPSTYDEKIVRKKWTAESVEIFSIFSDEILSLSIFTGEAAKAKLLEILEQNGVGIGKVMQALRVAVCGTGAGPDLMSILEVLGKDEVSARLKTAINKLPVKD